MNMMTVILALGFTQQAQAADVMHCYASSYAPDVTDKLAAHPDITSVTDFNCGSGTPSLDELLAHDAVLFYSDGSFSDTVGLGNVLADYVDAGGTAVEAVFSVADNIKVQGRLLDDGYRAMETGSQSSCSAGLVPELADHPLLAGVESFDGGSSGYCGSAATATPGADLVASWGSGEALVATHEPSGAGTVVALNFYPPSSDARDDFWSASTDGVQLMVNALTGGGGGDAGGSTTLTAEGSCPGPVTIEITGNPGDTYVLVAGESLGSTVIPGGSCAGTELGVESAGVLNKLGPIPDRDGDGVITMTPDLPRGACSYYLQALNTSDCSMSDVAKFETGGGFADEFDAGFDASIWDSLPDGFDYVDGQLLVSGDSRTMRTVDTYVPTNISGTLTKEESCDDQHVVLSSDPFYSWSWSSTPGAISFVWNCDTKYIYGQSSSASTSCSELATYDISIDISGDTATFRTSPFCEDVVFADSLLTSGPLYMYIGADDDSGTASWDRIELTE